MGACEIWWKTVYEAHPSEAKGDGVTTARAGNYRSSSLARGFKNAALIPLNIFSLCYLAHLGLFGLRKKNPIFSNLWGYPTCKLM